MAKLTRAQTDILQEFLSRQGLSFKPLRDEMVDHMRADLEDRISAGTSFEEAWLQVTDQISENHFQNIQKEVMETINKRFGFSQGLSFLALGLLFISLLFKVLHLQFGEVILLLSFALIGASLLISALSGISKYGKKRGSARLVAVVAGILILILGFSFKILHLPGADEIIITAVVVLIAALLVNTRFVYSHASGDGNLLTFLHEKYTPGIERFFLFLLIPLVAYKVVTLVSEQGVYVGNLILLIVIYGAGLQLIAISWRSMEKNLSKRNGYTLTATCVAGLCLTIPFLGPVAPFQFRVFLIIAFSVVAAWLAYEMEEDPTPASLYMAILSPIVFLGWTLIKLNVIPPSTHWIFFNLPVLVILTAGVFLCRKNGPMRAYMLVALSSYVFEYIG